MNEKVPTFRKYLTRGRDTPNALETPKHSFKETRTHEAPRGKGDPQAGMENMRHDKRSHADGARDHGIRCD